MSVYGIRYKCSYIIGLSSSFGKATMNPITLREKGSKKHLSPICLNPLPHDTAF